MFMIYIYVKTRKEHDIFFNILLKLQEPENAIFKIENI